jgi:hypothetical protein
MFTNKHVPVRSLEYLLDNFPEAICELCNFPLKHHDGLDCHIQVTSDTCKDTNPKDAIGSRKAPMSTLPAGVLAEIGVAMMEGKAKYGAFNYRIAGIRSSVYYDALQRHIMAWWEGEDIDPASGLPHVVKALSTLVVLRDAQRNGMVNDDRPPISLIDYDDLNAKTAAIIEMHKDKAPRQYTRDDPVVPLEERTNGPD